PTTPATRPRNRGRRRRGSNRLRPMVEERQVGAASGVGRLANAAAGLLPDRVLAGVLRRVYPRVEPELRRIAELTTGGGTVLDVGAWYGPWSHHLRRHAA